MIKERSLIRGKFSVGVVPRIDLDVLATNMRRDTFHCGMENDKHLSFPEARVPSWINVVRSIIIVYILSENGRTIDEDVD